MLVMTLKVEKEDGILCASLGMIWIADEPFPITATLFPEKS